MTVSLRATPVDRSKDPNAIIDFGFDWSKWLQTSETLSTSAWTAETGLTIESSPDPTTIIGGNTTAVFVSGGTAGVNYLLSNRVTTSGGRQDDRTFRIHVVDR